MKSFLALVATGTVLALLAASAVAAAPITKQNGSSPAFNNFTSICAVSGYVNYGLCGGSASTFGSVKGKINAIQPKVGRWNLGLSFSGLQPGGSYTLWGNQDGATPSAGVVGGFFNIATATADALGNVSFSYQTSNPD